MSKDHAPTIFVTKYALTEGISECPARKIDEDSYAYVEWPGGPSYGLQCGPKDWHYTREAALGRAEEMRRLKISSHEKSIAKLQKLSFT